MPLEPFGILQFLQSLLPQNAQTVENQPAQTEQAPPSDTEQKTETPSPVVEENRTTDAILQYMEEHDKRARKLKK